MNRISTNIQSYINKNGLSTDFPKILGKSENFLSQLLLFIGIKLVPQQCMIAYLHVS